MKNSESNKDEDKMHFLKPSLRIKAHFQMFTFSTIIFSLFIGLVTPLEFQPRQNAAAIQRIHEETVFDSKHDNHILFDHPETKSKMGETGPLYATETQSPSTDNNTKRYQKIQAFCGEQYMTIFSEFKKPFKGRIYADGYVDEPQCGTAAGSSASENVTFQLPYGNCGIHMTTINEIPENDMKHEVTLYIQYSSFLQQIIDVTIRVECVAAMSKVHVQEVSQSLIEDNGGSSRQGRRMGRKKKTQMAAKIGEAWMEILAGKEPIPNSRVTQPVAVGDDITLVISTKVKHGYDARIVNCSAHDGSKTHYDTPDGYRSQKLLDSAGCSVDKSLMPNVRKRRLPIESRDRSIAVHFSTFPAFKFPERQHIHFKCSIAYCRGPCPQEMCVKGENHFGSWRQKYGRIADVLLDTVEVFNSIEVFAPELESMGRSHQFERRQGDGVGSAAASSRKFSDTTSGGGSTSSAYTHHGYGAPVYRENQVPLLAPDPGDDSTGRHSNHVCVSPGTVILALVILGVVLVISATATLWFALKRSEARKYYQGTKHPALQPTPQPYYRFSHW